MRRLVVCGLLCGLVAVAAGCGMGGSQSGDSGAPEPGELVLDAFRAADAAGSFRYAVDVSLSKEGVQSMRLTIDGAFAERMARADVSFEGGGESLAGTLLFDGDGFFVRFMGVWYGQEGGFGPTQGLERELGSEEALAKRFEDVFEGSVAPGPVADGVPTWAFNGRLNVDGLLDLVEEERSLEGDTRDQLEELAASTRLTILVGKADLLPRSFLLDLSGEAADFMGIAGTDGGRLSLVVRGSFSGWGEPVKVTRPASYAPLDELYRQFFGF